MPRECRKQPTGQRQNVPKVIMATVSLGEIRFPNAKPRHIRRCRGWIFKLRRRRVACGDSDQDIALTAGVEC